MADQQEFIHLRLGRGRPDLVREAGDLGGIGRSAAMGDVEREDPVGAEMAEVPLPISHRQQKGKNREAER